MATPSWTFRVAPPLPSFPLATISLCHTLPLPVQATPLPGEPEPQPQTQKYPHNMVAPMWLILKLIKYHCCCSANNNTVLVLSYSSEEEKLTPPGSNEPSPNPSDPKDLWEKIWTTAIKEGDWEVASKFTVVQYRRGEQI